ncbi:MAG: hypothetical protein KF795_34095, partial [Labilithrix sp.]|nr:hypothetical protein [Labilithrix sp.]
AGAALLALSMAALQWIGGEARAPVSEATASPSTSAAPAEVGPAHAESRGAETASIRVEDLPPATSTARREAPPAATPERDASTASAPRPADSFREELALVERARAELSRGDASACLRTVDAYGAYVGPNGGVFTQEVEVMRIEALTRSGERRAAQEHGRRFLVDHPASPYAERVRSVLDKTE